jgi:hypothetical protein
MSEKPVDAFQAEHLRKAEAVRTEIYRKMTVQQKLDIDYKIYLMARELKAGWLRKCHPEWTEEQVEAKVQEIFLNARCSIINYFTSVSG